MFRSLMTIVAWSAAAIAGNATFPLMLASQTDQEGPAQVGKSASLADALRPAPGFSARKPTGQAGQTTLELSANRLHGPAASSVSPADRYSRSLLPVSYLEQNWTTEEAVEFYGLRQGSPVMRKDLFNALEQPDNADLFRDWEYMASFGFLPQRRHTANPEGYPVGFVGTSALEIACAACHTSRITHAGQEFRIDGSQAMTDLDTWLHELVRSMKLTLADAPLLDEGSPSSRILLDQDTKFGRFAARVLGSPAPRVSQVYVVRQTLEEDYLRRQQYNAYNDFGPVVPSASDPNSPDPHGSYGFGRLDALGAILNQACAEALHEHRNAAMADAPVNYPAIWDAPQHTHVQWNGAVDNTVLFGPLGRNAGQVVGVFGIVAADGDTVLGYDSSIRFDALERAEELVTKLWSPLWPAVFPRNAALVEQGATIYRQNCLACHALIQRDDPGRKAHDELVSIHLPHGLYSPLGTDPKAASNWNSRQARVAVLADRYENKPLGRRFPSDPNALVPARDIASHLVFRVIARSFVPWRDELTIEDASPEDFVFSAADTTDVLLRYKARPLNGVWSTAPYLHNGSVLNMVELLTAPNARLPSFRVGTTEYDPMNMGFANDGPFELDTTKDGNGNTGHAYGAQLAPDDKAALIEYLKTL